VSHLYLQLDRDYPEVWQLGPIVKAILAGGVGVIPTDTNYAFVCDLSHRDAVDRLYRVKGIDKKKPLSILCANDRMISHYTRGLPTSSFRAMRRCLPGPFTFIMKASGDIPRTTLRKRKTIGVRVPDDEICTSLLADLGIPLLCTSVRTPDDSHWNNPAQISETYDKRIDFVVDGGERLAEPSTVIDLTGDDPEIIRIGKGNPELFE
jgi:tRNA threonylcarbamoyl adenosine modification protein (Sua5/YciO/YrdC/YwlC family)